MTPTGDDKKSDRTRSQRSSADQQNKTAKLAQHEGKQGKFGSLSGHYSGLDELTQYFLSGRFRPSNVVLFLWCALLGFYAIKAFQLGFGFADCSAYYCPLSEFFGGVFAGIGFIMAVSIADFIGLEELLGGTWVFVGGPFAWIFIERLETTIALRKYMPSHQQIMEEMKNLESGTRSTSVNKQEVVRRLIQQNIRADEAKEKTSMVSLKGVFNNQGKITAVLLFLVLICVALVFGDGSPEKRLESDANKSQNNATVEKKTDGSLVQSPSDTDKCGWAYVPFARHFLC